MINEEITKEDGECTNLAPVMSWGGRAGCVQDCDNCDDWVKYTEEEDNK